MENGILHVDMNNFYASVETLFAPQYKDVPMAVAGDKESRHGIILAKNMLAKSMGVQTAEPIKSTTASPTRWRPSAWTSAGWTSTAARGFSATGSRLPSKSARR